LHDHDLRRGLLLARIARAARAMTAAACDDDGYREDTHESELVHAPNDAWRALTVALFSRKEV